MGVGPVRIAWDMPAAGNVSDGVADNRTGVNPRRVVGTVRVAWLVRGCEGVATTLDVARANLALRGGMTLGVLGWA